MEYKTYGNDNDIALLVMDIVSLATKEEHVSVFPDEEGAKSDGGKPMAPRTLL
jgi:hypothetical protein